MKKRSKVLAVLLCLAMALSVGCGSEKAEEKTDKADLAPQESADEPAALRPVPAHRKAQILCPDFPAHKQQPGPVCGAEPVKELSLAPVRQAQRRNPDLTPVLHS